VVRAGDVVALDEGERERGVDRGDLWVGTGRDRRAPSRETSGRSATAAARVDSRKPRSLSAGATESVMSSA